MKIKVLKSEKELIALSKQTHNMWPNSLNLEQYIEYQKILLEHPWSQKNFKYIYLEDKKHILSSAKLYKLPFIIDGNQYTGYEICAVYTPPEHRNKGYATLLLKNVIESLKKEKVIFFLYSDIDPAFYERLGFIKIPMIGGVIDVIRSYRKYRDIKPFFDPTRKKKSYKTREFPPYTRYYFRVDKLYIKKDLDFLNFRYSRYKKFNKLTNSNIKEIFLYLEDLGEAYLRLYSSYGIVLDTLITGISTDIISSYFGSLIDYLSKSGIKRINIWLPQKYHTKIRDFMIYIQNHRDNKNPVPMINPPKHLEEEIKNIINKDDFFFSKADLI